MKEGGLVCTDTSPKVTGLISGRARSASKTSRCLASRSALLVLLLVQNPKTSQLREPRLGFALAKGAPTEAQP